MTEKNLPGEALCRRVVLLQVRRVKELSADSGPIRCWTMAAVLAFQGSRRGSTLRWLLCASWPALRRAKVRGSLRRTPSLSLKLALGDVGLPLLGSGLPAGDRHSCEVEATDTDPASLLVLILALE